MAVSNWRAKRRNSSRQKHTNLIRPSFPFPFQIVRRLADWSELWTCKIHFCFAWINFRSDIWRTCIYTGVFNLSLNVCRLDYVIVERGRGFPVVVSDIGSRLPVETDVLQIDNFTNTLNINIMVSLIFGGFHGFTVFVWEFQDFRLFIWGFQDCFMHSEPCTENFTVRTFPITLIPKQGYLKTLIAYSEIETFWRSKSC